MAVTPETFLAPPDGVGELELDWFDWLPKAGSGDTRIEAVTAKLEAYIEASEVVLAAAGVAVTDAAQTAFVYWKAYDMLAKEYSRRVGSTTIHNEVTKAVGTATAKPFIDARNEWKAKWVIFVPEDGSGSGSGTSASVRSHFAY